MIMELWYITPRSLPDIPVAGTIAVPGKGYLHQVSRVISLRHLSFSDFRLLLGCTVERAKPFDEGPRIDPNDLPPGEQSLQD